MKKQKEKTSVSPVETDDIKTGEKPEITAEQPDGPVSREKAVADAVSAEAAAIVKSQAFSDKILTPAQKRKRTAQSWTFMFVGIIMMSCSVYFFQTPNDFTMGGVAGIAIVLANLLQPLIPSMSPDVIQGGLMVIINVFLLILGLIILGKQCTIKTIICSLFYSGFILLFGYLNVIGHINEAVGRVETVINPETGAEITKALRTLSDEPFMELVYSILLFGVGGALVFNSGSSSGGTDIIALILKKYTKLNVGFALMLIDFIVICISFYTFSIEGALFSMLGLFTKSFLLDGVIESIGKTKYITIITEKPELISDYILKDINHSFTMYDAEGGYSHQKKKVLITVCKRAEAIRLKMKIHQVDPMAFVIITDANEILGKGFGGTL
ncbi:MAG: YitT family protein [Clostridia bacterium]|nr:YitT family protein [Clostridia bacterium]